MVVLKYKRAKLVRAVAVASAIAWIMFSTGSVVLMLVAMIFAALAATQARLLITDLAAVRCDEKGLVVSTLWGLRRIDWSIFEGVEVETSTIRALHLIPIFRLRWLVFKKTGAALTARLRIPFSLLDASADEIAHASQIISACAAVAPLPGAADSDRQALPAWEARAAAATAAAARTKLEETARRMRENLSGPPRRDRAPGAQPGATAFGKRR